jgi:hypothetical protein
MFRRRLAEVIEGRGLMASTWSAEGQNSPHLIALSTTPEAKVLYVKEFNTTGRPGFWGLTRNQVDRLEKSDVKWFAVLLLRSSTAGYMLTAPEVRRLIADGSFELSRDGDYKVNEHLDLKPTHRFQALAELLDRLV